MGALDTACGCRYAILRFNPDPIRGEVLNVGVVLECPDTGQLLCDFGEEDRLRRWTQAFDGRIHRAIIADLREQTAGVQTQLSLFGEMATPSQPTGLDALVQRYGGQYELTEPRMVLVEDMDTTLKQLRQRLVDSPDVTHTTPQVRSEMTRFHLQLKRTLRVRRLLAQDRFVERIPLEGKRLGRLQFDFGFQNGHTTLLQGLWLGSANRLRTFERANFAGFRVKDVRDNDLGVHAYIVVGRSGDDYESDVVRQARELLEEQDISTRLPDQLDDLSKTLEQSLFSPHTYLGGYSTSDNGNSR